MQPEAVVQIARAIGETDVQMPDQVEESHLAATEGYHARTMSERMAQNSVPFSSHGEVDTSGMSYRERVRTTLNLNDPRRRNVK